MQVTPVPRHGDIVVGRDKLGRVLRISAHPGSDRVVLSIWQDGSCLATVRLDSGDVQHVAGLLTALQADLEPYPRSQTRAG